MYTALKFGWITHSTHTFSTYESLVEFCATIGTRIAYYGDDPIPYTQLEEDVEAYLSGYGVPVGPDCYHCHGSHLTATCWDRV